MAALVLKDDIQGSSSELTVLVIMILSCSAGWIRNPDGSWSKDPNVEFDSDEETS